MKDTKRQPDKQHNAPCPMPLALCLIGERFGVPPWEIETAPADRVEYYLSVLAAEGEYNSLYAGGDPDDLIEIGEDDG